MELLTTQHKMVTVYELDPDAEDLRNQRRRVRACQVCHLTTCPVLTAQATLDKLTGRT